MWRHGIDVSMDGNVKSLESARTSIAIAHWKSWSEDFAWLVSYQDGDGLTDVTEYELVGLVLVDLAVFCGVLRWRWT